MLIMWGRKKEQGRQRVTRDRAAPPITAVYSSYYNNKGQAPEKTIDLGSMSHRLRLVPTVIAAAVIVGSLLFSLTLTSRPSVSTLEDQASPYRSTDAYADAAAEIMNGSLGNKTKFSINTTEVEQKLMERFPELRAAALRLPVIGRRANLVIDIKSPVLLLNTSSRNYVLDNSGTVISEVHTLSEESRQKLLAVKDQGNLPVEIGKQAVTTDTVAFIQAVVAQLKAKQIEVTQLSLPPNNANQLDIRMNGMPYYLKTDVAGDARLQIGSFLAVKEKLERDRVAPAEYIDVRVEEKVFYK